MIIAAALNEQEEIVPIVEGDVLRIYDADLKEFQDYPNPALQVEQGKRGKTLQFAEEKGAIAFVTPPQTFCELSYEKARKDQVQFYPIETSISFQQFLQLLENDEVQIEDELVEGNIAPSQVLN